MPTVLHLFDELQVVLVFLAITFVIWNERRVAKRLLSEANFRDPIAHTLAEIKWHEEQLGAFRNMLDREEKLWAYVLPELTNNKQGVGPAASRTQWEQAVIGFQSEVNRLGLGIELSQHPNYSKNPAKPVFGEEQITSSDQDRYEFRRLFDEHESVLGGLTKVVEHCDYRRKELISQLGNFLNRPNMV